MIVQLLYMACDIAKKIRCSDYLHVNISRNCSSLNLFCPFESYTIIYERIGPGVVLYLSINLECVEKINLNAECM